MKTVRELIDLLTLEPLGNNRFRGHNYQTPWKRVFGGQVLGQALHAAYQTVPPDRIAHSMHGYFILGGKIDEPIEYAVDTIRDGGSFSTRRVVAFQEGKAIYITAASFQLRQQGFEHQERMPNVLPPETLLSDIEQLKDLKTSDPALYRRLTVIHPNAIEFRPVEKFRPENTRPSRHIWMRAKEEVVAGLPMQQQLLAYASDYNLLTTAALPHLNEALTSQVFYASLDHAMWFHRDFRMSDWLLYALDSPSAGNARALSRGSIFGQDGKLVASVVQEGLMRRV